MPKTKKIELVKEPSFADVSIYLELGGEKIVLKDFTHIKYKTGYKAEIVIKVGLDESQSLMEKVGKTRFDLSIEAGPYTHKIDKCELFITYEYDVTDEKLYATLLIDNIPRL